MNEKLAKRFEKEIEEVAEIILDFAWKSITDGDWYYSTDYMSIALPNEAGRLFRSFLWAKVVNLVEYKLIELFETEISFYGSQDQVYLQVHIHQDKKDD